MGLWMSGFNSKFCAMSRSRSGDVHVSVKKYIRGMLGKIKIWEGLAKFPLCPLRFSKGIVLRTTLCIRQCTRSNSKSYNNLPLLHPLSFLPLEA